MEKIVFGAQNDVAVRYAHPRAVPAQPRSRVTFFGASAPAGPKRLSTVRSPSRWNRCRRSALASGHRTVHHLPGGGRAAIENCCDGSRRSAPAEAVSALLNLIKGSRRGMLVAGGLPCGCDGPFSWLT